MARKAGRVAVNYVLNGWLLGAVTDAIANVAIVVVRMDTVLLGSFYRQDVVSGYLVSVCNGDSEPDIKVPLIRHHVRIRNMAVAATDYVHYH